MVLVVCPEFILLIARPLLEVARGGLFNHALLTGFPAHIYLSLTSFVAHALAFLNLVSTANRTGMATFPDKVKDTHRVRVVVAQRDELRIIA